MLAESGAGAKLLAGMKTTVGGMSTAFYTTLLGALLGGVVLRLLAHIVDNQADFLIAHVAELTEVYVLPALKEEARNRRARTLRRRRDEIPADLSEETR